MKPCLKTAAAREQKNAGRGGKPTFIILDYISAVPVRYLKEYINSSLFMNEDLLLKLKKKKAHPW